VAKYLAPYTEDLLGEYQCCFYRDSSASGQTVSLRMISETFCDYKVDINQLYADYKEAYDSINRYQLAVIMQDGVPSKLELLE
jgi:hypothetical protein